MKAIEKGYPVLTLDESDASAFDEIKAKYIKLKDSVNKEEVTYE